MISSQSVPSRGPLEGVRVLDFSTTFLGPSATLVFAQLGADVIKVEQGSGDIVRQIGEGRSPGMSPAFLRLNRGKRSVLADLKTADGQAFLNAVVPTCDVVLHNMRPQAAQRLGLHYEAISDLHAEVIYCAAYGFGRSGRYAGRAAYDDVIQCAAGFAHLQGINETGPRYAASTIADKTVGQTAVWAVLAALFDRERTGRGQSIDIPMYETMAADILFEHLQGHIYDPPVGSLGYSRTLSPHRRPYQSSDGHIGLLLYTDRHWRDFLVAVGRPDLVDDIRFTNATSRTNHIDHVYSFVADCLIERSTEEWMDLFDRLDVPAFPVRTLEDLEADPHLADVGFFEVEEHPTEGTLKQIRPTVEFGRSYEPDMRPAPTLGQHTKEVLDEALSGRLGPRNEGNRT